MTTPNAELAYRVLDHIDADPESWNQSRWVCGTAFCFGGWAIKIGADAVVSYSPGEAQIISGPQGLMGKTAEEAANEVLGLDRAWVGDEYEGGWLYDPTNDREDLGRMVESLFGPRPDGGA